MDYFTYYALYYIIGFVICMSYLIYETLTAEEDDDFDKTGFFTLILFFFWLIVIPVLIFMFIKRK